MYNLLLLLLCLIHIYVHRYNTVKKKKLKQLVKHFIKKKTSSLIIKVKSL